MSTRTRTPAVGADHVRADGPLKVRGAAPYAVEHAVDRPAYAAAIQASIARGAIRTIDVTRAEAVAGVLAVITHSNAERLASDEDKELWILQTPDVHFRGQLIGVVVAESAEVAKAAADLVQVTYDEAAHDVDLRADRDDLYKPDQVNPSYATDTCDGDVEAALAAADVLVDETYRSSGARS